jgi:diguanylate cyclase (GGDEF)-like protein
MESKMTTQPSSLELIVAPGFFSEHIALLSSFLVILLLIPLDLMTGAQVSFHVLYLFPLTVCALQSSRNDWVVVALALAITLQLFTHHALHGDSPLAMTVIAVSNSVFVLLVRYVRAHILEVRRLSTLDPLTQLFNRLALDNTLQAEMKRQHRYGGHFSVAMIDLDGFKKLNDTRGHKAGDEALKLMATLLRKQTRQSDTLARYGGDEFVIIMPNTQPADCEKLCWALCQQVGLQMKEKLDFPITASIGYKTVEPSAEVAYEKPGDILLIADRAMYQAKSMGKSCVARG